MQSIGSLFALPLILAYFVLIVFLIVKFFQMASDIRAIRRILTDSVRNQPPARPAAGTE